MCEPYFVYFVCLLYSYSSYLVHSAYFTYFIHLTNIYIFPSFVAFCSFHLCSFVFTLFASFVLMYFSYYIYIHIFHSLLLDDLFVLSIWFILICLNYCLNNSINFLSYIFVSLCNLFCPVPQSHNLNFNQRRAWWRRLATNLNNPQVDRTVFTVDIWVCLKIVYPFLPNGFADHYPYFLWLFHWEYSLFSSPNPYTVDCF